jgi:hypothetical protein
MCHPASTALLWVLMRSRQANAVNTVPHIETSESTAFIKAILETGGGLGETRAMAVTLEQLNTKSSMAGGCGHQRGCGHNAEMEELAMEHMDVMWSALTKLTKLTSVNFDYPRSPQDPSFIIDSYDSISTITQLR